MDWNIAVRTGPVHGLEYCSPYGTSTWTGQPKNIGLDSRTNKISVPVHRLETGTGVQPASRSMLTGAPFPRAKAAEREADHQISSKA
jgi:hypothetical protein